MLNIQNLHKIIGQKIHILDPPNIKEGTIEDVIEQFGNDRCSYIFKVQVYEPINPNLTGIGQYDIKLDRKRIQFPMFTPMFTNVTPSELNQYWELSYEEKPNQFIVEGVSKEMIENMGVFMMRLGEIMDRVLRNSHLVKVVQ
jgi:hypothetical protein